MSVDDKKLRELAKMAPGELGDDSLHLVGLSAEQKAVVQASAWAKALMKSERYKNAAAVLIAARQLYAIGYVELKRLMEETRQTKDVHHMTEDVLVQSAMYAASKPFNEHQFMKDFTGTAMPALADIIDRHTEQDEQADRAERAEREAARRKLPVPFPCRVDVDDEEPLLGRDRSVTFMGNFYACRLFTQKVLEAIQASPTPFTVLWLDDTRQPGPSGDARILRFAADRWAGCANKRDGFDRLVVEMILSAAPPGPIDLVVCGNLANAYTAGFKGRSDLANAGDGHHRLWKWCQSTGAALVAFVPEQTNLDGPDPDLTDPALEQLRTFSRLRPIKLRRDPVPEGEEPDGATPVRLLVGKAGHEIVTTVSGLQEFSSIYR